MHRLTTRHRLGRPGSAAAFRRRAPAPGRFRRTGVSGTPTVDTLRPHGAPPPRFLNSGVAPENLVCRRHVSRRRPAASAIAPALRQLGVEGPPPPALRAVLRHREGSPLSARGVPEHAPRGVVIDFPWGCEVLRAFDGDAVRFRDDAGTACDGAEPGCPRRFGVPSFFFCDQGPPARADVDAHLPTTAAPRLDLQRIAQTLRTNRPPRPSRDGVSSQPLVCPPARHGILMTQLMTLSWCLAL